MRLRSAGLSLLLILGMLLASLAAHAQQAGKVPRVGYVTSGGRGVNTDGFEQGLREPGYTIGRDIMIEYRFGDGRRLRVIWST
jgi:hypothetical protein